MKKIDYSYIIRLKKLGFSLNAIARQCGCKWETVQRTILRCDEAWGGIGNIPDGTTSDDIAYIINSGTGGHDSSYLQPDCDEVIQRCRKGEKRDMVWTDYVKKAEKAGLRAYQISRFNDIVSEYARQKDIAILMPKIPGQECQIDWVGDKACITDHDSKEKVELHLFVMVLPYSSYFYTEAFTDEKMASWLDGHRHAFEFFGGCPQVAIPDNCATATEEARSKYYEEVILNRRYSSFMDHYGIVVAPARSCRPKDKPAVEACVKIIETDLMPKLRKEEAGSVTEYNRALHRLLEERLAKDFSKRLGSRTSIFLSEEKGCLSPLPMTDFTVAVEREATVGRDFHIQYDKAFYSVPCSYVRAKVIVRDENGRITIYNRRRECIAVHDKALRQWQRKTDPSHEPQDYTGFSGFTPDKLIFRAQQIGDGMTEWTQAMLGRSVMKSDSFRTIDAVLRLAAASGKAAVEQACRTAVRNNVFTVKGMKSLIAGNAAKSRETAAVAPEEAVFFSPIYKEDER